MFDSRRYGTVVHIGLHKTGSSAIQHYLSLVARELPSAGFYYSPPGGRPAHHNVALEVKDSPSFDRSLGTLQDVLDGHAAVAPETTLMLSAESFGSFRRAHVEALIERLPTPVHVIAYVRPQDEFLESLYLQATKLGGNVLGFPEYVEAQESRRVADFARRLGHWRRAAGGAENMTVRLYDRSRFEEGSVVRDFARVVGLPGPEAGQERNPSIGSTTVEVLRTVKAQLRAREIPRELWSGVCGYVLQTCGKLPEGEDVPFVGFSREQRVELRARYEDSNRRLCKLYGLPPVKDWPLRSDPVMGGAAPTAERVQEILVDALIACAGVTTAVECGDEK